MSSGACSCQGTVHEPRCLLASFQSPSPECGRIERVPVSDPALLRIAAAADRIASALEAKATPPAPSVPPSPTVPHEPDATYVPRVGDVVTFVTATQEFVITRDDGDGSYHAYALRTKDEGVRLWARCGSASLVYVGVATPEQRVAAGLDKPVPPSDAPKFKVGDRVRATRKILSVEVGSLGTVVHWPSEDNGYDVRVEFDGGFECSCASSEISPVAAPTPAATTSEATDPRRVVGAVIAMHDSHPSCYRIVVSGGDTPSLMWLDNESKWSPYFDAASLVFVRWATREECERHGIPYVERGATTSEARPTHVRVKSHPTCSGFTKGKVYEVVEWFGGTPNVMDDTGMEHAMSCCEWEPAPPPVSPAAKPTTPAADEGDGIDGPYTEAVRLAELMLDPENQPPQYGANEGWRLFSDALSRARSGAGRKDGA